MKWPAIILCLAFLCGLNLPVGAAQIDSSYVARNWVAEDGLPDNRVLGLVQTSDGYLWIATHGALVRFDGIQFHRVRLAGYPEHVAGTLRVLMLDELGRVWLAKNENGSVFCFDGSQVQILTTDEGLPKNDSQCSMVLDEAGNLLITYVSGKVIRYNQNGTLDNLTVTNGLPGGNDICWLSKERNGTVWFAKSGRVGVFRDGKFSILGNIGSATVRIAAARGGGIWICDGQRVLKLKEGSELVGLNKILPDKPDGRSGLEPSVMLEDREGAVWVGTVAGGLFRCDSNAVTKVNISSPGILSLAEDREGDLWVGTRSGLSRLQRRKISIINTSDGLPFQGVQSACQDATGALWLVNENGMLVRGQGTKWTVQSPSGVPDQVHVNCVAAGQNGSVWIGAWGGSLYHWADGRFINLELQDKLRSHSPRSLLVMKNGDLWIGTDEPEVLYRLRGKQLQSFALPPGYRFIRAMAEDSAGNLWVGASDGLLVRVAGDDLQVVTAATKFFSIRCLHAAANGDLWMGYGGHGIARLQNGKFTYFNSDQGLPNDSVSQILTDDRGNVWFAGDQGIFEVREQDFDDLTHGLTTRIWPVVYGRSENLPGLQANFNYCPDSWRFGDERLFFSMLSGLAEIKLDNIRLNYQPPKVCVERVLVDDQVVNLYQSFRMATPAKIFSPANTTISHTPDEIRIRPGVQQVQFEFTGLSFTAPENVRFRYRLEGLDNGWVDSGTRRVASYSHPPPGRYRFSVIACNNDGIWNKTGYAIPVVFEPFFWETIWFKASVSFASFICLGGIVVAILRHRHRIEVRELERQRAVEQERVRIARDLHDDLGVGLTEIGLLGDLAGTNAILPDASRGKLQEITDKARSLAASLDEIVWAINPANDVTQSLTEYFFEYAQKLLNRAGIRCRLRVVQPMMAVALTAEVRHGLFHAFKEALNNIIRHADATEVQIILSLVDDNLNICVADNGRGLLPPDSGGSHDGLLGMRERLRDLGGRCEIDSNPGRGTTVTFVIPIKTNNRS